MFEPKAWDVIVVGAGPAGLSAAIAAHSAGAKVCVIEREEQPGGILKQCIHDGFGLIRFKEKLTGPEYAYRYVCQAMERNITFVFNTFLTDIQKENSGYRLSLINSESGVEIHIAPAIIFATGCRERTDRQVFIQGTRPSGIYYAGQAQYFVNIQGYMPTKRCVILGSGDIGLIMARRLTLEGAEVEGVYEIKHEPSGLTRNIAQCLEDYNIPLHLGRTVSRVEGDCRLSAVITVEVDKAMKPIEGTEKRVECDALILSVGLIPENEVLVLLGITLDKRTGGPAVDQNMMTETRGIFCCGNALHVNDLVDYVSESGEIAGRSAARFAKESIIYRKMLRVEAGQEFLYVVPQCIDRTSKEDVVLYFRSRRVREDSVVRILQGEKEVFRKKYIKLKPPEMERLVLKQNMLADIDEPLTFTIEDENG